MKRFVLSRSLTSLLLLWLVASLTFVAIHLAPGDPTTTLLDARASRSQAAALKAHLGLDQSVLTQYGVWIKRCLQGDLGTSLLYQRSTASVIREHLPATVILGTFATLLGSIVGLLVGVLGAKKKGSWIDRLSQMTSIALYASPPFWLGLMLILGFGGGLLRWFPSAGMLSPLAPVDANLWSPSLWPSLLHHLVLPGVVLATPLAVQLSRLIRVGLDEQLGQDHITAARAMGFSEAKLVFMALRNSLGPVVQALGLWLPVLVGGAVIVEQVFSWPGLGSVTVAAISGRDYSLVLAMTLLSATAVVLGSLLADLIYAAIDPRVALGRSSGGSGTLGSSSSIEREPQQGELENESHG